MQNVNRRKLLRFSAPAVASLFVVAFELLRGAKDSMWSDEIFSYWAAHQSFGSLLHQLWTREANMGPYYLALWFWVRIGNSDTWIRALSALATVVAIWGIWLVARRWSGARVAAVAVAVFALSPFVLSWSMQARGYSMAMAFTAWALVFADTLVRGDGRRSWVVSAAVFGAMVGLAVAAHLAAAGVFVGMIITMVVLAPGRRMVRNLAVSGVVAGVCFAPFAIAVAQDPSQDWIPDLDLQFFVKQLVEAGGGSFGALMIALGLVCAVIAAVEAGELPQRRLDSYRTLRAELTELARRHSLGEERFSHGLVGPMLISQPHPTIRAVLESLKVGEVHAPFRVDSWVLLVLMEHRQPASLNDATRIQLQQELLQQDLDETLDAVLAAFYPTLVAAPESSILAT
jgi:hypothetical protein